MINFENLEVVCQLGEGLFAGSLKKGSKVLCTSTDESQSRWGGNDSAAEYLTIGDAYTLSRDPEIHSWHTKFYLEEIPDKKFNSVQFAGVEDEQKPLCISCGEKPTNHPDSPYCQECEDRIDRPKDFSGLMKEVE